MSHDLISQYLGDIAAEVREIEDAKVEHYEEELLAANRVNLRVRVRFLSGYLLELNEAAIVEAGQLNHLGYRYHFQDKQNNLVFRYDNTPHFPDIESFPHHKHLSDKVTGIEKPSILEVIDEGRLLAK
ncbi:MAG: DUF6516 family protein [Thermodesulfobacteriota bacterium]|nr:DUF6516 family protein [Thermodesulfobacteriota bacterium]